MQFVHEIFVCVHVLKMTTLQESLKEKELELEAMARKNTQLERRL